MSLPVTFHRAASAEFIEASARPNELALLSSSWPKLTVAYRWHLNALLQFAVVREDVRRVVANRFPYSVYFRAEKHRIVVLAVFHGNRNPAIWQARA